MNHLPHVLVAAALVLFAAAAGAGTPDAYRARWRDPAVVARIDANIEKHRKGDAAITITDADGKAVSGAQVRGIGFQYHYFRREKLDAFLADASGTARFRGFHGKYAVHVTAGGMTREFPFELKSGEPASRATFRMK